MKTIKLTKGKVALVDDEDFEWLNKWKWYSHSYGYATRFVYNKQTRIQLFMHRFIMNTPKGMDTDHINGNKLDNRKENLRICTHAENTYNQRIRSNNTSGYKGVSYFKRDKKWDAYIIINDHKMNLGRFNFIQDAINAYNNAAHKYYGKFANLNLNKENV